MILIKYVFRRLKRAPIPAIGVLLFAAILCAVLCGLEMANTAEQNKYKETYRTIEVEATVTNLSGTKYTDLNLDAYLVYEFTQNLGGYIQNIQKVSTQAIDGIYQGKMLYCITSTVLSPELSPDNGAVITWKEGYNDDIFAGNEPLCLIPDGMMTQTDEETGAEYVDLYFTHRQTVDKSTEYTCRLTVAGTYMGGSKDAIYTPYFIYEEVCEQLETYSSLQAFRATLIDNEELEEFRTASKAWFAEPNPLGKETVWENGIYTYYPFALDINDELLQRASATLQNSIAVNSVCTILILFLSAGAGLLIGFLMVRSRKKEIALMRTMGTPNISVYACFAFEQMVCFVIGIILGGSYNLWQSINKLIILPLIFYVGLSAALIVFLRKNLIITIKEDD